MKLSHKLQNLVDQGLISQEQAEKIMISTQSARSNLMWKWMFWIAGLLIGVGIILIIGSNWRYIPDPVKLLGNFAIWGGVLYGTYWSIVNKRNGLKEFFLTLSFLFVGATIGLIGQVFHLSGGWHSFSLTWVLLSFVFVLFSRLVSLNFVWLCLFFFAVNLDFLFRLLEPLFKSGTVMALASMTGLFALLAYAGNRLYKAVEQVIVLPKAFAVLCFLNMYCVAFIGGAILGLGHFWANVFVFVFLGVRLFMAIKDQNMKSFIRNTHLTELFILFLFLTRFGSLFISGIGFVFGGILLLGILYLFKKTSDHIKTMEIFHE